MSRSLGRYHASVEFRRASRATPWVLAGIWIGHVTFVPALPGVEPVTGRLPQTGLIAWADLPLIVAPTTSAAGEAALQLARQAWPDTARPRPPFAILP